MDDFVVERKMTLITFWSPSIGLCLSSGQFVKGGQHKLTRVYERDVVDCKGSVAFHVVEDDCNFS